MHAERPLESQPEAPSRGAVGVYLGLYLLTTVVAFRAGSLVPTPTGYLLLMALFILPVILAERDGLPALWEAFFLFATPLLPMLIVIDPFEAGLFGYDAYSFTIPALDYFRNGVSIGEFVSDDGDWPAFYAVALVLQQLTGVDTVVLSKYLPLFVVAVPYVAYAGIEQFATRRIAFHTGMVVASTRTLLLFEVKFVDETIAVLLFFTAIVYLALTAGTRRAVVGFAVVVTALVLTHHATSLFFGILMIGLIGGPLLARAPLPDLLARRVVPQRGTPIGVRITGAVLVAAGVAAVFLFLAPQLTTGLIETAFESLFGSRETTSAVQSGSGGGLFSISGVPPRQLVSRAALPLFALMAGVAALGILTRYKTAYWEFGWTAAAGVFAVLYLLSVVGGRVVPLGPIRILLFLVATLTPVTLSVVSRVRSPARLRNQLAQISPDRRDVRVMRGVVAVLIVSLLIMTQVAAFDPHILYTNPDKTVIGEGHHTSAQFGASQWTEQHYSGGAVGAERSLWVAHDNSYRNPLHGEGACETLLTAWRPGTGDARPENVSIVFDSTDISLTRSAGDAYIPGASSNTQLTPNDNAGSPKCGTFVRSKFTNSD